MTGFKLPTGAMSGYVLTSDAAGLGTWQQASGGNGSTNHWNLTGNAGTTTSNFLGTTDDQPLELRVNNLRGFRLEPNPSSPNVIGGYLGNKVSVNMVGATISGGGVEAAVNWVTDDYATIGGGAGNLAGRNPARGASPAPYATIRTTWHWVCKPPSPVGLITKPAEIMPQSAAAKGIWPNGLK